MKYDYIVIGAGLAGSYCNYLLSKFSSTLLIEKANFIRKYPNEGLFERHNYSYFEKSDLPLENKKIFPQEHEYLCYSGKKADGIINCKEFGDSLGKFCNTNEFYTYLNQKAEKNGSELLFETDVSGIKIFNDSAVVYCDTNKEYTADVVLIATGAGDISKIDMNSRMNNSKAFHLQKSIGFDIPDLYCGSITQFEADEDTLKQNFNTHYMYHYNRKISPVGPLYATQWPNHFNIGVLHNDFYNATDRLVAIIERYKHIQRFFTNTKPKSYPNCEMKDTQFGKISIFKKAVTKHPVKRKTIHRALLLGQAAGLVTSFFYEGLLGCVGSAKIAADILKNLHEVQDNTKYKATPQFLSKYDEELDRMLINTYLKAQHSSEILWMNSGDAGEVIYNIYADLLTKQKDLRKHVYDVLVLQDLSKYNFENDRKSGEEMYKALPISQKLLYSPIFLKAAFK